MSPSNSGAPTAAAAARPRAGWSLLTSELVLLFRRRRTWVLLATLAAIPVLVAVAVRLSTARAPGSGRGPAFLDQITQNGLFVSVVALTICVPLFLPLAVGVVAGDTLAGEAGAGTLRYLLVAPVGRIRLLLVKFAAAIAFCLAATVVITAAGALIGAALFPIGPVVLLSGDTIGVPDSIVRALLIAGYVTVSLAGLTAIGLFVSTLTDAPVGAMAATVVISIVAQVLDSLPQLDWLHPYLFTHYWLGFADLLRQPVEFSSFSSNALLQLAYVLIFGSLAIGRFTSKDILS